MPALKNNLLVTLSPQSGKPLLLTLNTPTPITTASVGVIATLVATGGAGGYAYSIAAGSLPSGTTLDTLTGAISIIGALTPGLYSFVAQVQDANSAVFLHSFSIQVNSRLVVVRGTPTNGHGGAPYAFSFLVTGGTGTISYAITSGAGGLPPNVSLTAAGVLATVPSGANIPSVGFGGAIVPFTVTATDSGSGESVSIPINWFLYSSLTALPGASLPAPLLTGVPYFWAWVPSPTEPFVGGLPPYTFAVTSGSLPPGVTLNSATGAFSGIPSAAGSGIFSWQCTDAWGAKSATGVVPWVVRDPQNAIQPQLNGASVGAPGPIQLNFAGAGVQSVTNSAQTATVTIPAGAGASGVAPITVAAGVVSHNTSGVAAGTYGRLTVNATGHVTAGSENWRTIYTRALGINLAYSSFDFSSMTSATDVVRLTGATAGKSQARGFFASPRAGQVVMMVNASSVTFTLNNEDTGEGTAAARFSIGANFAIAPGHAATLWYDSASSRWRIVGAY